MKTRGVGHLHCNLHQNKPYGNLKLNHHGRKVEKKVAAVLVLDSFLDSLVDIYHVYQRMLHLGHFVQFFCQNLWAGYNTDQHHDNIQQKLG